MPTNLSAVMDGTEIRLNWTDNSTNEAGFVIHVYGGDRIYTGPDATSARNNARRSARHAVVLRGGRVQRGR